MSKIAMLATVFLFCLSRSIPAIQRSEICPVLLDPQQLLLTESKARDHVRNTRRDEEPRIVGGDVTGKDLRRYLAQIISIDFICSGVLVAPRVVFTAAHCGVVPGDSVLLGGSEIYDGTRVSVKNVVTPGRYDPYEYRYDFMIIILSRDAPDGSGYMLVNMNERIPIEGSAVRAVGYGLMAEDDYISDTGKLRQVDVPVVSSRVCRKAYESIVTVDEEVHVCAGYSEGNCDACQGDSGGPLMQYDRKGRPVIVGLTSFGEGCARPRFPGVYTRTNIFRKLLSDIDNVSFTYEVETVFTSPSPSPDLLSPPSPTDSTSSSERIIVIIAIISIVVVIASIILLKFCSRRM